MSLVVVSLSFPSRTAKRPYPFHRTISGREPPKSHSTPEHQSRVPVPVGWEASASAARPPKHVVWGFKLKVKRFSVWALQNCPFKIEISGTFCKHRNTFLLLWGTTTPLSCWGAWGAKPSGPRDSWNLGANTMMPQDSGAAQGFEGFRIYSLGLDRIEGEVGCSNGGSQKPFAFPTTSHSKHHPQLAPTYQQGRRSSM